jgi:hypothetical protein
VQVTNVVPIGNTEPDAGAQAAGRLHDSSSVASAKAALSRLGSLKLRSNGLVCTFGPTMLTSGTLVAARGSAMLPWPRTPRPGW